MHFLNYFYTKTLKSDLINKFYYMNLKKLPHLKHIILNFSCKKIELKTFAIHLLALELINNQKGVITFSKRPNILLKIKKGNPTGCKITLRKTKMLNFLSKSFNKVFPTIKNFKILISPKIKKNAFSFSIKDLLTFPELAEHYYFFKNLSNINLSCVTKNVNTKKEMLFFLKSLEFFFKS